MEEMEGSFALRKFRVAAFTCSSPFFGSATLIPYAPIAVDCTASTSQLGPRWDLLRRLLFPDLAWLGLNSSLLCLYNVPPGLFVSRGPFFCATRREVGQFLTPWLERGRKKGWKGLEHVDKLLG